MQSAFRLRAQRQPSTESRPLAPPAHGAWTGILGALAAFGAGLPGSYLLVRALKYTTTSAHFILMTLSGVAITLVLFIALLRRE